MYKYVFWAAQNSKLISYLFVDALFLFLRDIINQGFSNMVTLPDSDDFDCVTCTCIADVDWDGSNEIILGTYGQVLF